MIELKDGIRSLVKIDFKGRVHKKFRGTGAKERFENEVKVLKILENRNCPNVPRLLESYPEEHYFISTNCGKPAENTISRKKSDYLFQELEEKYGVRHDDPEPRNITYSSQLGRFCVIDFELAEILSEVSCVQEQSLTRLRWATLSQQGKRHLTNQDSALCLIKDSEAIQTYSHGEIILPCERALFCVSDGVGGNGGGEFASKLIVRIMQYELSKNDSQPYSPERFKAQIQDIHGVMNQKANDNEHASKLSATFVGMIFEAERLIFANAGDSRLYRLREGEFTQLSKDHTFAFGSWKRGELNEHQFRAHPRKNILFEALGGGHQNTNPTVGEADWQSGDVYLLCSDGVIDGLWDRKIKAELAEDLEAEEIAENILKKACTNAGQDDTTLIVLKIS